MEAASLPPPETAPPPEALTEDAILAALTLLALTPNLPEPDLLAAVEALLAPVGIAADAARAAALLAFGAALTLPREGAGQAYQFTARTAPARRAAYLLNAAKRIDVAHRRVEPQMRAAESLQGVGDDVDAQKVRERAAKDARAEDGERRHLIQHLNAERIRAEVATRIDATAGVYGPVLGWRAKNDERTTPECRAAHGQNFRAERPPAIGWPGTLHGGSCRCVPGRPFDGAMLLA